MTVEQQKQLDHIVRLRRDAIWVACVPGHESAFGTPHKYAAFNPHRAAQLIANGHATLDELTYNAEQEIASLKARIAKLEAK